MQVSPGDKFGPYRIVALSSRSGMIEAHRAITIRSEPTPNCSAKHQIGMPDNTSVIAQGISAILFCFYGLYALFSASMVREFQRYGLDRFRVLTGLLQVAGSLGIMMGHFYSPLLLISSGGLTVMMLLGVITRVRIKDPLSAALPAFALGALNFFIFATAL